MFDPLLPYETWKGLGARVGVYASTTSWWLGDWLVFGQHKYGRRYKEAISATGLDYQTLRNYAVVARRFAPARRRADLTFQHHAEVCALSDAEQDLWLERAAAGGWSRNRLRRELRARDEAALAPVQTVRLTIDGQRVARWRTAAARAGDDLGTWMIRSLDEAERRTAPLERPAGDAGTAPAALRHTRRSSPPAPS